MLFLGMSSFVHDVKRRSACVVEVKETYSVLDGSLLCDMRCKNDKHKVGLVLGCSAFVAYSQWVSCLALRHRSGPHGAHSGATDHATTRIVLDAFQEARILADMALESH